MDLPKLRETNVQPLFESVPALNYMEDVWLSL